MGFEEERAEGQKYIDETFGDRLKQMPAAMHRLEMNHEIGNDSQQENPKIFAVPGNAARPLKIQQYMSIGLYARRPYLGGSAACIQSSACNDYRWSKKYW